jgi:hypothetical protein
VRDRIVTISTAAGLAALLLLAGSPPVGAQPQVLVEDWSGQPAGKTGIPNGWKGQNWGSPKYDFRVVTEGSAKVLHMKSADEGSTISKEIKVDLKQFPMLCWRWKAVALPKGGDSRKKDTDDQGAQVYVTFPRFPQAVRSRIIGYVWDTTAPAGTIAKSEKTGTVTYVVMRSGTAELGKWISECRNVHEDYKRIYGEEPSDPVGAMSVAIDSNDTHSTAESFVGEIVFRKP